MLGVESSEWQRAVKWKKSLSFEYTRTERRIKKRRNSVFISSLRCRLLSEPSPLVDWFTLSFWWGSGWLAGSSFVCLQIQYNNSHSLFLSLSLCSNIQTIYFYFSSVERSNATKWSSFFFVGGSSAHYAIIYIAWINASARRESPRKKRTSKTTKRRD